MPHVPDALVARLVESAGAPIVAARGEARWEPFFARYEAVLVRPVLAARLASGRRDQRNLQGLFVDLPAEALEMTPDEHASLRDWDSPADMHADLHKDLT